MNFDLSEEQVMLRDGLRQLLASACDLRHVRSVVLSSDARDPELWQQLTQAGWTSLTVPEAFGGAGVGLGGLIRVAMEAGRAMLPLPLVTTLLAARTLAHGQSGTGLQQLLAGVMNGSISMTLALRGSPDDWNGERVGVRAVKSA